mgnify:FL=1
MSEPERYNIVFEIGLEDITSILDNEVVSIAGRRGNDIRAYMYDEEDYSVEIENEGIYKVGMPVSMVTENDSQKRYSLRTEIDDDDEDETHVIYSSIKFPWRDNLERKNSQFVSEER